MILGLLSVTILPFTLMLSQSAILSKGVYVASTRNLFSVNTADQMDAARSDYAQFNDAAMDTSLSESGQVLPFRVIVDTTNSDTFTKIASLYFYNNASDPASSPISTSNLFKAFDVFRQRCGSTDNLIDMSHMEWAGDKAYSAANKQPGYLSTGSTTASYATTIANASGVDATLFQNAREGVSNGNVDYNFDVANGDYTVTLYFAENSSTTTASSPNRRRMDIWVEGVAKDTDFSPFESSGGLYRAILKSYDVTVADNVLNVSVRKGATSDKQVSLNGIVVKKIQVQ
jgi:hypothetical protein